MDKCITSAEARRIDEETILTLGETVDISSAYPHRTVKKAVESAISGLNLKVVNKIYSCSTDAKHLTSLWETDTCIEGKRMCIIWRNSLSKFWSVGFCGALCYPDVSLYVSLGTFKPIRRHTGRFEQEGLDHLVRVSTDAVYNSIFAIHQWQKNLLEIKVTEEMVDSLIIGAIRAKALVPNKLVTFDNLLSFIGYDQMTLYLFHGCLIKMMKNDHLQRLMERSLAITNFINKAKPTISNL